MAVHENYITALKGEFSFKRLENYSIFTKQKRYIYVLTLLDIMFTILAVFKHSYEYVMMLWFWFHSHSTNPV